MQTMTEDKQCFQRDTTEGRCLEVGSWKNMLDVDVIPRCMMSTRQWSRPETNVCWETTCRHTVTFATKVCCARTLFKAKFLFRLVLNTLPAKSMTYNALVVMVCSGERSTRSTQRITECDTAQTERILTRFVITSRPDSRSVSSHEKRSNTAQHPCNASVPSCVVEPRVTRTLSVAPETTLRARVLECTFTNPQRFASQERGGKTSFQTCTTLTRTVV